MEIEEVLQSMVNQATVRTVYGDPVTAEGRTIVPVARVRYGFGSGSGSRTGERPGQGGGGGGGLLAVPVGVVEISSEGTRFISLEERWKVVLAVGLGICIGWLLAKQSRAE
jgi:uncharacterized spore protein YtfJ